MKKQSKELRNTNRFPSDITVVLRGKIIDVKVLRWPGFEPRISVVGREGQTVVPQPVPKEREESCAACQNDKCPCGPNQRKKGERLLAREREVTRVKSEGRFPEGDASNEKSRFENKFKM